MCYFLVKGTFFKGLLKNMLIWDEEEGEEEKCLKSGFPHRVCLHLPDESQIRGLVRAEVELFILYNCLLRFFP